MLRRIIAEKLKNKKKLFELLPLFEFVLCNFANVISWKLLYFVGRGLKLLSACKVQLVDYLVKLKKII